MSAVGGSIESVSVDGRTFAVAADAEAQRGIGGFSNEIQMNGNGTARQVKTRMAWSVTGVTLSIDDARGDHEFLQNIADGSAFVPMSVTQANGEVYQGEGTLAGGEMITFNTQNATAEVTMSGPGRLTRQ